MNLESKLEALLFFKGEPLQTKKAQSLLECSTEELAQAIDSLAKNLSSRGLRLVRNGDEIELRTAPEVSQFIEKMTKDELIKDLGKAGLETLTIILYKHPIRRSEIDYIRGVNSSFILRNLLIRGLIERVTEKEGKTDGVGRGYAYKPTMSMLSHLGLTKIEDLPEYDKVKSEMDSFAASENES
jgi:segregation and condensation protein B